MGKLMCVILIYSGGLSSMNVGVERVPGFVRSISIRCDTECLFALLKDASFSLLNVLAPGRLWPPLFNLVAAVYPHRMAPLATSFPQFTSWERLLSFPGCLV